MARPCVYLSTSSARLLPPVVVGSVRTVTLDLVALVDEGLPPLERLVPAALSGGSGELWAECLGTLSALVEWRFPDRPDVLAHLGSLLAAHVSDPWDGTPEVFLAFCDETMNDPSVRGDVTVLFEDWSLRHGDADLGLLDWDDLALPAPEDLRSLPPRVARVLLDDCRSLVSLHAPEPLASQLLSRLALLT